jgi:hypothetical protein
VYIKLTVLFGTLCCCCLDGIFLSNLDAALSRIFPHVYAKCELTDCIDEHDDVNSRDRCCCATMFSESGQSHPQGWGHPQILLCAPSSVAPGRCLDTHIVQNDAAPLLEAKGIDGFAHTITRKTQCGASKNILEIAFNRSHRLKTKKFTQNSKFPA